MRPKIDRDVLGGERELFAGQSMKLVASVVSEPPAKVSFVSPSGAILEASEGVTVKQVYRKVQQNFITEMENVYYI